MNPLIQPCGNCVDFVAAACNSILFSELGLENDTTYIWLLSDNFNNKWYKEFTTDGAGQFTIEEGDLPDGLFSAGTNLLLQIVEEVTTPAPVPEPAVTTQNLVELTVEEQTYTCINLSFENQINLDEEIEDEE